MQMISCGCAGLKQGLGQTLLDAAMQSISTEAVRLMHANQEGFLLLMKCARLACVAMSDITLAAMCDAL